MLKKNIFGIIKDYAVITFGCALYSFSFVAFFDANELPMGGFTGVAQIIIEFLPFFPVGFLVLLLNLPILAVGIKKQGIKILFATAYSVFISNLLIDITEYLFVFPSIDPLLASLYGGALMGVALGVLMIKNATTGGTELAARLLKYVIPGISIGKICLAIDVTVVSLYSIVNSAENNGLNLVMYGIIAMYVCSITMDMVVYGSINAKLMYIVSDKNDEIRARLLEMGLGVTVMNGHGGYTGLRKDIIICAARPSKMAQVKRTVSDIDSKNAFIIVCDAKEVFGEGFGEYSGDSL